MADQSNSHPPGAIGRVADLVASDTRDATEQELREANVRPSARRVFDALSHEQQDEIYGVEGAEKIRNGEASLADFVQRSSPGDTPGFIQQKPVEDL